MVTYTDPRGYRIEWNSLLGWDSYAIAGYFAHRLESKFAAEEVRDRRGNPTESWWENTGTHWQPCSLEHIEEFVEEDRHRVLKEIEDRTSGDDQKVWREFKDLVGGRRRKRELKRTLRYEMRNKLVLPPLNELNEFATLNGVLILEKDQEPELRPFRPNKDGFRACLPTTPSEHVGPFETLMKQWIPDQEVRHYFQRVLGGAMLGQLDRRYLVLVGDESSGVTACRNVLQASVGDYGYASNNALWNPSVYSDINNGLVDLIEGQHYRLVFLSECHKAIVDKEILYRITDGDSMLPCRRPYGHLITGYVRATPVFFGEGPPQIRWIRECMPSGMMRRQQVIRFSSGDTCVETPDLTKQVKDPNSEVVKSCMRWWIRGMQMWLHNPDSTPPPAVEKANQEALRVQVVVW